MMRTRMANPAMFVPGAMEALQTLGSLLQAGSAPAGTAALVHLRASQINGCSVCVEFGAKAALGGGDSPERLVALSAWRESPRFSEAEKAALALTEAVTRLSDQSDPVPDTVWAEAARHYDEAALAHILLAIAVTNLYNRLNVPTRQQAAEQAPEWSA